MTERLYLLHDQRSHRSRQRRADGDALRFLGASEAQIAAVLAYFQPEPAAPEPARGQWPIPAGVTSEIHDLLADPLVAALQPAVRRHAEDGPLPE